MSARRQRLAFLIGSTLTGIAVGIAFDYLDGTQVRPWEIVATAVLSPVTVPLGVRAVSLGRFAYLSTALTVGGVLFWPVYIGLALYGVKRGRWWTWFLIALWTAQGFFEAVGRLQVVMSA